MSEDLSKRPDLLIVSDTAVYVNVEGRHLAFEPVVREIEHFSHLFNKITWIASQYPFNSGIKNIREVSGVDIRYILFPAAGGPGLGQRMRILGAYFRFAFQIPYYIKRAGVIHTRGPSHPALVTIFYSIFFFRSKVFWHKYAGNWNREKDPFSYRINKVLLKKARRTKVVINGRWPDQPEHCLSFENPCLTRGEREEGRHVLGRKHYEGVLDFVFVGNLEDHKGVRRIIEAFSQLKDDPRIGLLHIIGDGSKRNDYEDLARIGSIKVEFHGFLPKSEVNKILSEAHVLLLPSDSEGFPKVVAEGSNYGCVPVVSDISCLSQYVSDRVNGFLMSSPDTAGLLQSLNELLAMSGDDLRTIALRAYEMSRSFTYDHYNQRIETEILPGLPVKRSQKQPG